MDVLRQKKFLKRLLIPIFEKYPDAIDKEDYRKIMLYGTTIPALMGEAFCSLRGSANTIDERMSISFFASLTGLFDDLFDRKNLSDTHILHLLQNPELVIAQDAHESVIVQLYNNGLKLAAQAEKAKETALSVFYAQSNARLQKNTDVSYEQLKEICDQKGGSSMLFYRCALKADFSSNDDSLVYLLGATGQLANDIFDIYKDFHEQIQTVATNAKVIEELRKLYEDKVDSIFYLIQESSFSTNDKVIFSKYCSLILSRTLVALDHLQKAAETTHGVFNPSRYTRKMLICDMEKPANMFKMLHYAAKRLSSFKKHSKKMVFN